MPSALEKLLAEHTASAAPELVRTGDDGRIQCLACAHRCRIADGRSGVCRVRFNHNGELRVPSGYVAGLQIDPIEKKPFFHVYPGANALSFGMLGCDFHCPFCQNWISSQTLRDKRADVGPSLASLDQLTELAVKHRPAVCVSTYNEPLITAEWAVEIFKRMRQMGIACGFVSNGHATPEVLEYLQPYVDFYKVDLKSFDENVYHRLGGHLNAVLDTIGRLKEMGFWVEVVTLVVPDMNDSDDELRNIAQFLAGVSPNIPWHATAFRPDYKMTDPPPTPLDTLIRAYEIGKEAGLKFVYTGNRPGGVGDRENTYCPNCSALLIRRWGFSIEENRLQADRCPDCNTKIPGVW